MDYRQLKADVKEIAEIAASVPEQFRDKCFEILLSGRGVASPRGVSRETEPHLTLVNAL
jgi:hypothetical protein